VEGIGMSEIKEERVTDLSIIMEMIDSKPYYSVQYRNVGEDGYNIGYSSYNLKTVLEFIGEYFEIVESDRQTNSDRIRNMSDEELAEWIHNMCDFEKDEEPYKSIYNLDTEQEEEIHDSYGDLLKWLQSEVKVEESEEK
jgi:hypothetical protein